MSWYSEPLTTSALRFSRMHDCGFPELQEHTYLLLDQRLVLRNTPVLHIGCHAGVVHVDT